MNNFNLSTLKTIEKTLKVRNYTIPKKLIYGHQKDQNFFREFKHRAS